MRQLSIACAIVIAGLAFAPAAARADGTGVIAIRASDVDRGTVSKAMAAAIAEARPARLVDDAIADARAAVAAGSVPISRLERFRRVREQIEDAWRAYLRVRVDYAASRLASARTDAEALVALPGGATLYADAALRLGAVLNHLGRTAEAQAILALAVALDPERPITLAEFSPDVVAAVDAARAQTRPTRQIRIASDPPGALVSIDGKELGRAPLHADVSLGQHVVVARMPLYEPHGIAVAVDDTTNEIALELDRDVASLRLAEGASVGLAEARAQELVDATLRFADLDQVVLAADSDRRGGPTLLVQRCAGLPARCTAVVEVGYGDRSGLVAAAREAWETVRNADLRYPPSVFADSRFAGKKLDDRCELCRSPILWGGVGVAAVITTIAVIAIVSSSRPPPIVVADPDQF